MSTTYALTRPQLDRIAIQTEGRFQLCCTMHPNAGSNPIYQDGCLRLLCRECGFEAARVKVAGEGS
jgi:hypothetical protein